MDEMHTLNMILPEDAAPECWPTIDYSLQKLGAKLVHADSRVHQYRMPVPLLEKVCEMAAQLGVSITDEQ